jgi:DNA-nicking Smr family endonuclease
MTTKNKLSTGGSLDQLADLVNKAGICLKTQNKIPPAEIPMRRDTEIPEAVLPAPASPCSDEQLFAGAMEGVKRASWRHDPHPLSKRPPAPEGDPDLEAHRLMREAFEKDSPTAILDHPEYIEGWIGVAGKRYLPKLRNGLYSIQGQIDLHGLNRAEAQIVVEEYIIRMSRLHSCCIKIIHGRGINSPTDRATLKESLQRLLSTRRMSRYVVAYASAPFNDGGVGAVYVLLSRQ